MTDISRLNQLKQQAQHIQTAPAFGKIIEVKGTLIKAILPKAKVGALCRIVNIHDKAVFMAEIVGFTDQYALLTPLGDLIGIAKESYVECFESTHSLAVGPHLIGKILDGMGQLTQPLTAPITNFRECPVYAAPPDPLTRKMVETPLALGIRSIDALLTCGEGQRIGIFAGAGVGKTSLLGMMAKNSDADINVIALIGERGREVNEFLKRDLGPEGIAKSVIVIATSDRPAMERVKAALVATAIAEYFRSEGKKVLLLMDSITRFARAYREIGLAAGEPPTRRGFPPSVFSQLPRLLERSGNSDKGSITAFYTVLVEGDDMSDPIADEVRSILDGHLILSRELADQAHYPAIDILASKSRVMDAVVDKEHIQAANEIKRLMAKYKDIELLVQIGEYKSGSDVIGDRAVKKISAIKLFLQQQTNQFFKFSDTKSDLLKLSR
jgi:type III secretion protein N (ATPase)